jgi:hypothetical protein
MCDLVDFIATGGRSEYVVSTLRNLEAFTRQERAALAELEQASREPLHLPSIDEVCAQVADRDAGLAQDPEAGREQLRRLVELGSWRLVHQVGGDRRYAELAGMLLVELEFGGWSPGRRRSPARPSSSGMSWLSSSLAAIPELLERAHTAKETSFPNVPDSSVANSHPGRWSISRRHSGQ